MAQTYQIQGASQDSKYLNELRELGESSFSKFESSGAIKDISKAIDCWSLLALLIPDSHTNNQILLHSLGSAFLRRFQCMGELTDLEKAVEYGEKAVSLTNGGHSDKHRILCHLGNSYFARFQRLGELEDLENSINCGSEAVLLAPDGHPDKPTLLNNISGLYLARFLCLSKLPDLEQSIKYGAAAVSLTPDDLTDKPVRLSNLGNSYFSRFQRLGKLTELNKAIECGEKAASSTPDSSINKPAILSNLGNAYLARRQHLGDLLDLTRAMECGAEALSLAPSSDIGDIGRAAQFGSIGNSYQTRFELLGELSDLDQAIEYQVAAAAPTPNSDINKPAALINLGNVFLDRFEHLGEPLDLAKAIEYGIEAVSLTPDSYTNKPVFLHSLGNSYYARFKSLGEPLDLQNYIECQMRAVLMTPSDHVLRPGRLSNLAGSYTTRFETLGELSDLDEAIKIGAEAVSLTPDGHSCKPVLLSNLGRVYNIRFLHSQHHSDIELSINCFKAAAQMVSGPPTVRFKACWMWAQLASNNHNISTPSRAYHRAMELISQVVWIGTTLNRRYSVVADISGIATEAASYAIGTGKYNFALEWLEIGRSVIWGQISQLRTSSNQLSIHHPVLANRLKEVGHSLENAGNRSTSALQVDSDNRNVVEELNAHIQLALDWDLLLNEVHLIPGFEDFLRPTKATRILQFGAAYPHPIALINLHESRCDALILRPNEYAIFHVPLKQFSVKEAIAAHQHFVKRKLPIDQLPRITWCTTGVLSFLPLHAAGLFDQSESNAFDLVVSSYTPSFAALLAHKSASLDTQCGILAIGQAEAPGLSTLPCVKEELRIIGNHAQDKVYLQLEDEEATVDQALDAMDQFSWVHMACHGSQDADDPTQSAFHLHDGGLTLASISKRLFCNKGLAFLSACQTAAGHKELPDEAVHLAAGMMLAGYPSVIATMWSIVDEDGPLIADIVYVELLQDGNMDYTRAARALHRAVTSLRAKVGEDSFERWAPFIHLGA